MDKASIEAVMAHIDGELDDLERAQMETAISNDKALQETAEKFRLTGRGLGDVFGGVLREPVPQHLIDLVMGSAQPVAADTANVSRIDSARRQPRGAVRGSISSNAPFMRLAAGVALLVIAGSGAWLIHEQRRPAGQSTASTGWLAGVTVALQQALESTPTGTVVTVQGAASGDAKVRAVSTFVDQGDRYCREYEISRASDTFVGFACRTNPGDWVVEQQARRTAGPDAPKYLKTAKKELASPVAAGVERAAKGGVLDAKEEQILIGSGWRAPLPPR